MMAAPAAVGTNPAANGAARPMPPHLTSAMAEQILAQACDNENQNAKRLRLGLEPISQPLPAVRHLFFFFCSIIFSRVIFHDPQFRLLTLDRTWKGRAVTMKRGLLDWLLVSRQELFKVLLDRMQPSAPPQLPPISSGQLSVPTSDPAALHPLPPTLLVTIKTRKMQRISKKLSIFVIIGATDLSFKSSRPALTPNGPSSTSSSQNSPLPHRLSSAEQLAVRQLITGYRESAQFLLRSAEELEQLLLQPQNSH